MKIYVCALITTQGETLLSAKLEKPTSHHHVLAEIDVEMPQTALDEVHVLALDDYEIAIAEKIRELQNTLSNLHNRSEK
jgi:hypothetical protein